MPDYNAFGDLYDQRPEVRIHERLRHSKTAREVASLAAEQNFAVSFERGPFRQDLVIKWNYPENQKTESHTVTSGLRYFKRLRSFGGQ